MLNVTENVFNPNTQKQGNNMSTDFDLACMTHEVSIHLGQVGIAHGNFGYGKNDEAGRQAALQFLVDHTNGDCVTRAFYSENVPEGFEEIDTDQVENTPETKKEALLQRLLTYPTPPETT